MAGTTAGSARLSLKGWLLALACLVLCVALAGAGREAFAQAPGAPAADHAAAPAPVSYWERLWEGFVGALVYGLLGIVLMMAGFKAFEWITPRLDIEKELAERSNIAVAVVCAAVIIAIAVIIASVIN
jgi:putative membrane protein